MRITRGLSVLAIMVGAFFIANASNALASNNLHPCRNWQQGTLTTSQFRADVPKYPACAKAWALATGVKNSKFVPSDYVVVKSDIKLQTGTVVVNNGYDNSGKAHAYKYKVQKGDLFALIKNTKTGKVVRAKQNCLNETPTAPPSVVESLQPMPTLVAWSITNIDNSVTVTGSFNTTINNYGSKPASKPAKPAAKKPAPPLFVYVTKTYIINGTVVPGVPFGVREIRGTKRSVIATRTIVSGKTTKVLVKQLGDQLCEIVVSPFHLLEKNCPYITGNGQKITWTNVVGAAPATQPAPAPAAPSPTAGGGGTSTTSTSSSSGASSAAAGGSSSSGAAGAASSGSGGSSSSTSSSAAAAAGPSGAAAAGAASAGASSAGGGSSSSSSSTSSASSSSSSTVVVVTPTPAPAPAPNRSPSGNIAVPQHAYVTTNTSAPSTSYICVDNLFDPDGDPITVSFSVTAGTLQGSVFTQPNGARCITYLSPTTVQQVTATVTLTDGRGGSFVQSNNFPIAPSQF